MSAAAASERPAAGALPVAAVLTAMSMVVMDAGRAGFAAPALARALGVTAAQSLLVVTAYQAAVAVALLPSGAMGARFGHRRVFVVGVALFALGSAGAMLAPALAWLVVARCLQGLGAGAVMALGIALLRMVLAPERLSRAIGWNALTVAFSAAAAPGLAALMLDQAGWRWLFAANLPVSVAVMGLAAALPKGGKSAQPVDPISILLNGGAFSLVVIAAGAIRRDAGFSALAALAGVACLIALVCRERPKAAPMAPFDLFEDRRFGGAVLASILCFSGQTAGLVALPFMLQDSLGLAARRAGLYLTIWPLGVAAAAAVSGRLADHFSNRVVCAWGAALLAAGLAATALTAGANAGLLILALALSGAGFGLFQTPNNRNMLLAAPAARSGAAGAMQGLARLTGQSAGAVVVAAMLGQTGADRAALWLGALLALAAAGVSARRSGRRVTTA